MLQPGEQVLGGAYGVSGPNPLWAQGLLGLAGFLIFGMRYYYYVALTDRRLVFVDASFWTSRPKGFAWADPRDSITISDLQTDNKLWNWGKISSPTKQDLRMNFHAFWRPELKAMGDVLADRIVGPRLAPEPPAIRTPAAGRRRHHPHRPRCRRLRRRRRAERSTRDALLPWRGSGGVAQSGRALPSHGRGQGFESPHLHQEKAAGQRLDLADEGPDRIRLSMQQGAINGRQLATRLTKEKWPKYPSSTTAMTTSPTDANERARTYRRARPFNPWSVLWKWRSGIDTPG